MNKNDVMLSTMEKEVKTTFSSKNIADFESTVLGKILTIIDASIVDKEQREAMKSLIKQQVWSTTDIVVKWMAEQQGEGGSTFPY